MNKLRRLEVAIALLVGVVVIGTCGYWLLFDFAWLDALYQTVTTVTTVGFREVEPIEGGGKVFTMGLIVSGVGLALYTLSIGIEMLVEGELNQARRRRRMDRHIDGMSGHVVICGWGRVGKAIAAQLEQQGESLVVVDSENARLEGLSHPHVIGDATSDEILLQAGVTRAKALIAAIDTDAANLYVTLSGRFLKPDLFIIARARDASSESKLLRAGADRIVNPQAIGGARMAAFVSQPHVAEFLDVVMHDQQFEFRLGEVPISEGSPLAGRTLAEGNIREKTGALVLAIRSETGEFLSHPSPATQIRPGCVLIAIGTRDEIESLRAFDAGDAVS